jgi:hypothetical protein
MNFIKYNIHIFLTWFNYILLGKEVSKEAIDFIETKYNWTSRQKRLINRIKNKNKQLWKKDL